MEDSIMEERHSRFVSTNSKTEHDFEDILTDNQVIFAYQAIKQFAQFYPAYLDSRRQEYQDMLANEEFIEKVKDKTSKLKLELIKESFKYEDIANFIPIVMTHDEKSYRKYFSENSCITKALFTDDPLTNSQQRFCNDLIKKIRSNRYPMIWYYTTDQGRKLWFSNKNTVNFYSKEFRRDYQYTDIGPDSWLERITSLNSRREAAVKSEVTDEYSARKKISAIYYLCQSQVHDLLRIEIHSLLFFSPVFNHCSERILYRGENMTQREFQNFYERTEASLANHEFQSLSLQFSSFTSDEGIARRFLQSSTNNNTNIKVLHKTYLVRPEQEDLDEFTRLFPDICVYQGCASIEALSVYGNYEKEILCLPDMRTRIRKLYHEEATGTWIVESLTTIFRIKFSFPSQDSPDLHFENNENYIELQQAIQSRHVSHIMELKAKYCDYFPTIYMDCLNKMSFYKAAFEIFYSHDGDSLEHEKELRNNLNYLKTLI